MKLSEIVTVARIEASLGKSLSVDRVDSADWRVLANREPVSAYGIAARAWHLAVTERGSTLDTHALARYFQAEDPQLAGAIEQVTGQPALQEFGFMEATVVHRGESFVAATSMVAHLTANELFWYDIAMEDPTAPLAPGERKSPSHHYRGFALLSEVVENVLAVGRERDCRTVGLMAAHKPLVRVFERFGFAVEDSAMGRAGMRYGISIPMTQPLR